MFWATVDCLLYKLVILEYAYMISAIKEKYFIFRNFSSSSSTGFSVYVEAPTFVRMLNTIVSPKEAPEPKLKSNFFAYLLLSCAFVVLVSKNEIN